MFLKRFNRLLSHMKKGTRNVVLAPFSVVSATALSKELLTLSDSGLRTMSQSPNSLSDTEAMHCVVNNITHAYSIFQQELNTNGGGTDPHQVLGMLDERARDTKRILADLRVSDCAEATEIGLRTLNAFFRSEQQIKQRHIILPPDNRTAGDTAAPATPTISSAEKEVTRTEMVIPSSLLYQLHHSLFPAERMIVGAGRRTGHRISVDALFDVTGAASAAGVKADPARLSRALISMSETSTYFALWVHSHPSTGPDMTRPSHIDLAQHADWLRDFSSDLVSAIVVKDRYLRFWGTALDQKQISVNIEGPGVVCVSAADHVYYLQS